MRRFSLASLFLAVLIFSGLSWAATSHDVTVSISPFARLSVTGTVAFQVDPNDFDQNGFASKEVADAVQLTVKTNSSTGCMVSASGTDFTGGAAKFSIGALKVKIGSGNYVPLSNSPAQVLQIQGVKNNTTYPVTFQLNLDGSEPAGNYSATVTYTVAANS